MNKRHLGIGISAGVVICLLVLVGSVPLLHARREEVSEQFVVVLGFWGLAFGVFLSAAYLMRRK